MKYIYQFPFVVSLLLFYSNLSLAVNVLDEGEFIMAHPSRKMARRVTDPETRLAKLKAKAQQTAESVCKLRKDREGSGPFVQNFKLRDLTIEEANAARIKAKTVKNDELVYEEYRFSFPWFYRDVLSKQETEELLRDSFYWQFSLGCTAYCATRTVLDPSWIIHPSTGKDMVALADFLYAVVYRAPQIPAELKKYWNQLCRAAGRQPMDDRTVHECRAQGLPLEQCTPAWTKYTGGPVPHKIFAELNCGPHPASPAPSDEADPKEKED